MCSIGNFKARRNETVNCQHCESRLYWFWLAFAFEKNIDHERNHYLYSYVELKPFNMDSYDYTEWSNWRPGRVMPCFRTDSREPLLESCLLQEKVALAVLGRMQMIGEERRKQELHKLHVEERKLKLELDVEEQKLKLELLKLEIRLKELQLPEGKK